MIISKLFKRFREWLSPAEPRQNRGGRPTVSFDRDNVARLRQEGLSWRQIEHEVGVSERTLRRGMKGYVAPPPRAPAPAPAQVSRDRSDELMDEIDRMTRRAPAPSVNPAPRHRIGDHIERDGKTFEIVTVSPVSGDYMSIRPVEPATPSPVRPAPAPVHDSSDAVRAAVLAKFDGDAIGVGDYPAVKPWSPPEEELQQPSAKPLPEVPKDPSLPRLVNITANTKIFFLAAHNPPAVLTGLGQSEGDWYRNAVVIVPCVTEALRDSHPFQNAEKVIVVIEPGDLLFLTSVAACSWLRDRCVVAEGAIGTGRLCWNELTAADDRGLHTRWSSPSGVTLATFAKRFPPVPAASDIEGIRRICASPSYGCHPVTRSS